MAQQLAQFCTECGAPLQAGQRFCSNCGATTEGAGANAPIAAAPQTPPGALPSTYPAAPSASGDAAESTQLASSMPGGPDNRQSSLPQPPPPPPALSTYNPFTTGSPAGSQVYPQSNSSFSSPGGGNFTALPAYAQKPKSSHGCLITSIILLVILAAGIGGFILTRPHSSPNTNTSQQTPTSSAANGGTPATTSMESSEQLNLKITYASVDITILSAQLASSFPDDNSSPGSAGVVRINLQENNASTGNPDYLLSDSMLLVLPGGNTLREGSDEHNISPDTGVNRSNWIDFPLDTHVPLSQLALHIGQASENQMDVPLRAGANLNQYQDKTSSPNASFQYAGVNWTLKSATLSYSYNDRQATTGNLYVILNLAASNSSSNDFLNSPSSYMRLQANGNSAQPDSATTIPLTINAGTTASGVVAFLMPQNATSFTLVMLAQPNGSPPAVQASQNFQIQ